MDKIPAYFKDKEPPIKSYQCTNTVVNKLFNFSSTLSNLDITNYLSNPQHCQCNTSKLCHEPHGRPYYHMRFKGHRECQMKRACCQRT